MPTIWKHKEYGLWLKYSETTTHTGTKKTSKLVEDINDATVMRHLPIGFAQFYKPVEVEVEVRIVESDQAVDFDAIPKKFYAEDAPTVDTVGDLMDVLNELPRSMSIFQNHASRVEVRVCGSTSDPVLSFDFKYESGGVD